MQVAATKYGDWRCVGSKSVPVADRGLHYVSRYDLPGGTSGSVGHVSFAGASNARTRGRPMNACATAYRSQCGTCGRLRNVR